MKVYICGNDHTFQNIEASSNEELEVKLISCGFDHIILVTTDNIIYSLGLNHHGQLGLGDNLTNYESFQQVKCYPLKNQSIKLLSCGYSHNVLVTESNEIWCTGSNKYGQLALGHAVNVNKWEKVAQFTLDSIKFVSCGGNHTIIATETNQIWTTGYNNRGQLGHNDILDRSLFKRVDTGGSFRDRLFGVGSLHGKAIKSIACGGSHSVVLTVDYGLWMCGSNRFGQLGLGYSKFYFNSLIFQQIHSSIPRDLGTKTIKHVACGVEHTYLVTDAGVMYSVGYNQFGQLGQEHTTDTNTFHPAVKNQHIIDRLCGTSPSHTTIMITKSGELVGCGFNGNLQLGMEGKRNRSIVEMSPLEISGDEEIITAAHGARVTAVVIGTRKEVKKKFSQDLIERSSKSNSILMYDQIAIAQIKDTFEQEKQFILQELDQEKLTNIRLKQVNAQLLAVLKKNLMQWKIPASEIEMSDRINDGSYGRVFQGQWKEELVAIKVFDLHYFDWNAGIASEIGILANISHPNCVKFHAFTEDDDKLQIVTELMEDNLYNLLHSQTMELTGKKKLFMALEIAKGIQHLHSQDPIVLHMDIKSENILINKNGETVKITDFGLSELTSCSFVEMGALGTAEYIAPEAILGMRSCACDVYSFGILLYEIWYRKRPYSDANLLTDDLMKQVLAGHRRPQIETVNDPTMTPSHNEVVELIKKCWNPEASFRPDFNTIVDVLAKIITKLQ
jgi:alpha-tubulin suppressor-like RCC1 family protein